MLAARVVLLARRCVLMSKQKAEKPPHAAGCWPREWAIFCWLRINPDVAKSYGIAKCNGQTTMGSMLEQMLRAQGADIDWLDELPESAAALQKGTNAWSAAFISRFAKRPGRRLKSLRQRLQELLAKDHVTPGVTAAVGRKDGKTPRLNFPKIAELAAKRRAKVSTRCYNKVEACAEVAFVLCPPALRHPAGGPPRPRCNHRVGAGERHRRGPHRAASECTLVHVPQIRGRKVGLLRRRCACADPGLCRHSHPAPVPRSWLRLRTGRNRALLCAWVHWVSRCVMSVCPTHRVSVVMMP